MLKADPYVQIKLGKKKINNKESFVPNNLNPVFGHVFELNAILPIEKDLRIRIYDNDALAKDDVIGETFIDLENRLLSKYRGTIGLSKTFCKYYTFKVRWKHFLNTFLKVWTNQMARLPTSKRDIARNLQII